MTEPSRDRAVTDSGGTMVRLTEPPRAVTPDLSLLEQLRTRARAEPVRAAGAPPYFATGDVVSWFYGDWVDVLRVVRDDERGLVAWLPRGSERIVAVAVDGQGLRDRPVEERPNVERVLRAVTWRGPGVLRIAPAERPWSVWYFTDETDGSFEGHYVNLELPHERPVDGSPRVLSRDLVLDVWVEDGETWLKDVDELEAGVTVGKFTATQGAVIRDVAELARAELIEPRAWPLDEGWETWRPPEGWDEPLTLPASVALRS
ncbi:DUF402 domain-containing protein [Nocardioides cynanchi]|uniref:DUF402 domain-containing protein n=1 Tax=Nocardioides cynanchi TaxID=2558918 RepID=UPI001243F773|nr:DUF402 domain-containing protein [Nocardioides cynanchi]